MFLRASLPCPRRSHLKPFCSPSCIPRKGSTPPPPPRHMLPRGLLVLACCRKPGASVTSSSRLKADESIRCLGFSSTHSWRDPSSLDALTFLPTSFDPGVASLFGNSKGAVLAVRRGTLGISPLPPEDLRLLAAGPVRFPKRVLGRPALRDGPSWAAGQPAGQVRALLPEISSIWKGECNRDGC